MLLRGIDYGPVWDASGVRGFFGEGYSHHKYLKWLGLNFNGSTFVAKTTPLMPRKGNMPLQEDGATPVESRPNCILPNFKKGKIILSAKMFCKGLMLNAVGLSSPGALALLNMHKWQARNDNFLISFMSVEPTRAKRLQELETFVELMQVCLPNFRGKPALQINFSCPNVGLDPSELIDEVVQSLLIACVLNIPLVPKFNVLAPVAAVAEICKCDHCDAICVSNTVQWGKLENSINWKKLFGTDVSPLAKFGGGGLSGYPLLKLVAEWVAEARYTGITKPINAGGGILHPRDVDVLYKANASSIFIGSVATLRFWRVPSIITRAHQLFCKGTLS